MPRKNYIQVVVSDPQLQRLKDTASQDQLSVPEAARRSIDLRGKLALYMEDRDIIVAKRTASGEVATIATLADFVKSLS